MQIQEVMKETGLGKRTIHYYIEEQLIRPKINAKNGYNIFSKSDVEQLKMIQQLRKADFSINDIRLILQYPNTIHYYLERHETQLEKDYDLLKQKLDSLKQFSARLPIIVSYDDLYHALVSTFFPDKGAALHPLFSKDNDAKLVSLFLWGSFLKDIPMTEYRQYLWQKILKEMSKANDSNIINLKKYLNLLSADELDEEFTRRYAYIQEIINLSPKNYGTYIEYMKSKLTAIAADAKFQTKWCNSYFTSTLPVTYLYDSSINGLVRELSPHFTKYTDNIYVCCEEVYNWLHTPKGEVILLKLLHSLKGYINIEDYHHGELAALVGLAY